MSHNDETLFRLSLIDVQPLSMIIDLTDFSQNSNETERIPSDQIHDQIQTWNASTPMRQTRNRSSPSPKQMRQQEKLLEEAAKRDHRRIGKVSNSPNEIKKNCAQ